MAPKRADKVPLPVQDSLIVSPTVAFFVFSAVRVVAAFYSPILDCDETYNYWEPTHYLNHGNGLQTWEYSPEFAIRSWLYTLIHAIPIYFASLSPFLASKSFEFYFLRILLGYVCAVAETRLYTAISYAMNPRIGLYVMLCLASSAGMFHASVAYLPSSFAMYCIMFALPHFLDRRPTASFSMGVIWLAVGSVIGWPFIGIFSVPLVVERYLLCRVTKRYPEFAKAIVESIGGAIIALGLEHAIDSRFYKKSVYVPWNIVSYNVLSGSEKGPNIYGTDPWHWYIRNLLINFNVWFLLALVSFPLLAVQCLYRRKVASRLNFVPSLCFIAPFYLWLMIFTVQPHKEERFMYPLYPFLAINAGLSIHIALQILGARSSNSQKPFIPVFLTFIMTVVVALLAILLGASRAAAISTGYSAPFDVYGALAEYDPSLNANETAHADQSLRFSVCVGKEWYRFPSSYHLPPNARLKFIKSEFSGLLPGEFLEQPNSGYGVPAGTWTMPHGMNDQNREDTSKYVDVAQCQFLVDSFFPGQEQSYLEPDYILDRKTWRIVKCEAFLYNDLTHLLGRLFWLPESWNLPEKYHRRWGQYCLLQRRTDNRAAMKEALEHMGVI